MVELIPVPDPHALLPHLLACLPTAFASSRPPPALLPLLSPVLKQRLQIIPSTGTGHDNWLRLLCWDNNKAEQLKEAVENATFEPHPSSGELELGDVDPIVYKRVDEETLRSNIGIPEYGLHAVYVWCTGGEDGNGWRLAELLPYENATHVDESWSRTIDEANTSSRGRLVDEALNKADMANRLAPGAKAEDDDDYWAQYDNTPGRTPAVKRSPAPPAGGQSAEMEYYSRYGDVQPDMDNEGDQDEVEGIGESTLNGNSLSNILSNHTEIEDDRSPPMSHFPPNHVTDTMDEDEAMMLTQPRPESPSTNGSDIVARLEETAERHAASEVGIKQHISTTMKSMYRLAKSAGIDKEEFERIVSRELETLAILDQAE